jgi:dolichyl-phosphate beta-glucosyltransferase
MAIPEREAPISPSSPSVTAARSVPSEGAGREVGTPGEVFLSVIIPAYNESQRIPATLRQVTSYLESLGRVCEVVVVDDGSRDDTVALVEKFGREVPGLRLVRHAVNCGKGAAVRNGMRNARGEYLLFSDADLSAPIEEAGPILQQLERGYDVVIGSRGLKREWIGVRQSGFRETAGKLFNRVMRFLTGLDFRDTQCGFKAFRRSAAQAIFAAQRIEGFGFDVELLYLARKFGYRSLEVPVHWNHSAATKVSPLRDGVRMFFDLLRIRWNDWRGKYEGSRDRE